MRNLIVLAGLVLGATGCGGGSNAITDPKDLPPLTAADMEEIRQQDAEVMEAESGSYVAKPARTRAARSVRSRPHG